MKKSLVTVAVALASVFALTSPAPAGASATQTWRISLSGVGPIKVGMTMAQAEASGRFSFAGGCGPRVAGQPGHAMEIWFPQNLTAIFVTKARYGSYRFATASGVRVGSTVADLRRGEKGLSLSRKPVFTSYAPGEFNYVYYQHAGATHWAMYVLPHNVTSRSQIRPWTRLTEIAISNYQLGAVGGC